MEKRLTKFACLAAILVVAVGYRAVPRKEPAAPWTLKRFTLRGASVDFLLNYREHLAKELGGAIVLLETPAYARLKGLAGSYSFKYSEDAFGEGAFSKREGDSMAEVVSTTSLDAKRFIGQPIFVGDAYGECGYMPSKAATDRDLKQILAAHPAWKFSLDFNPKERWGDAVFWRWGDGSSIGPPSPDDPQQALLIQLIKFLGGKSFPPGFFLTYHSVSLGGGCGDEGELASMADGALPRYLNVDIAVIENNSDRMLRVSDFQGKANGAIALRSTAQDGAKMTAYGPTAWKPVDRLAPGQRLIVPLRLVFTYQDYDFASPIQPRDIITRPTAAETRAFLSEMKRRKQLQVAIFDEGESERRIVMPYNMMARYAALKWSDPLITTDFVYGPSFTLASFKVSETPANPVRTKSQSIAYTTAGGYGSCPFVSIWDEGRQMWIEKGRVLIGRVGLSAAAEEVYDLDHPPLRVAVMEREPEVTYLSDLWLEVLTSAGPIRLRPADGGAGVIGQDERVVATFDVPEALRACPTKLHIKGYYIPRPRITIVDGAAAGTPRLER